MKVALLSPIAWRTPPRHYGPWELIVSHLAEGLVKKGVDVTLFATGDSITSGKLDAICPFPYEEHDEMDPKVWEALHIAHLYEKAAYFDIIHNNYDFMPLIFTRLIATPVLTTIHGFSSPKILPVFKEYNNSTYYVSISNADRDEDLHYIKTIYHGINLEDFTFNDTSGDYLLYFGRIHHDKGTEEAINIAKLSNKQLLIAGIIQDRDYYNRCVAPFIDNEQIIYVGTAGPYERNCLMGNALALLHPINFNEPFGLSVVESMACGTPVIAFNKGSMPEVIDDGKTGYLVDTIEQAVERVKDLNYIQRNDCRKWVEQKFSMERMISDYISVYSEILGTSYDT